MFLQKLKAYYKSKRIRLSPYVFNEAFAKKQAIEAQAHTIEVLGLGSSFCARNFNTDMVPNAVNLGTTDQDLYTTDWLFQKYLPTLLNLKKVVFFYGVFSPGHELEKTRSEKTVAIHHYVFGVPYNVDYLPKYKKAYLHRLKKAKRTSLPASGYIPTPQDFNPHPMDLEFRVNSHLKNNRRGTNQTRHLGNICKLCKQKGIALYVVIAPVHKDYIRALKSIKDKTLFKELFALTQKNHIPVLNKLRDKSFKENEFYDCDHLNKQGALHLTQSILNFIK
ncbi:MAG: DUF1574 family protein [Alphaproteobacteria bacterium]|nr:DUF1574 family protein [Alphaproteobacteria bacterium]